jgi:cation:H+ antiporter
MTGSNRLLLGLGWPAVGFLTWLFHRKRSVLLDRGNVPALAFLTAATAYSFLLPIRGAISLVDSAILLAIFVGYAAVTARAEQVEPELVGPAAAIGALSAPRRRLAIAALLAFAGVTIGMSAEPFAEGLVHTGRSLHIDEFLLVQWLAPLASEAPEFLIAALLARHGKAGSALGLLLAAKVNQWTVLVSSLPIAYSAGAGHLASLPLDTRQAAEVLLTAAQSLFGLSVLATMSLTLRRSALLAGLFLLQLAMGGVIRIAWGSAGGAMDELLIFSVFYLLLAAVFSYRARGSILSVFRQTIRGEEAGS